LRDRGLIGLMVYSFARIGGARHAMTEQLNQSERVLQQHFDPERTEPDRPDRLLKTRELATLLGFYLDRSVRYGLMDAEPADEARRFLEALEQGYVLRFTRSALVFDIDKPGTEPPENEVGIEFHRVGSDLIRALVDQTAPQSTTLPSTEGGAGPIPPEGTPPTIAPIPRLDAAAFLVGERQRTTTMKQARDEEPVAPKTGGIAEEQATPSLGACASPAEIAQRKWATCQSHGFQPGAQALSECLMKVDQKRSNREATEATVWNAHAYSMGQPTIPGAQSPFLGATQSEPLGQMWAWPNLR
jgi:hypothetical protein